MNYTLHQLQVLVKVVETGSITRTAEELNLTQPAVSIQLKNLQEQFDVPLTEVINRRLHITEFGREIARMAEQVLNDVQGINFHTSEYKGLLAGKLKLAIVSTGKYVMPWFLQGFLKKHPQIEFTMDVTNRSRVIESLAGNSVDMALVSLQPEGLQTEHMALMENRLFLIGNRELAAGLNSLNAEEVSQLTLIFREDGSATRKVMDQYFMLRGLPVQRRMTLTSNEAVKQAVIAGLGFSVMPLIGLRHELDSGELQIIPAEGLPIISEWQLVWLKGKRLLPPAKAYLQHLEQTRRHLLDTHFNWLSRWTRNN